VWLLPVLSAVSSTTARVYYRLTVSGADVPARGPVLLVANHPNSLIDPMMVAAGAGRPVRFLAKAPLFEAPQSRWLVRAAGAIPVYRRVDNPELVGENVDMFRAVYAELAAGAAIGLFPEGRSHSDPSLSPLKTGAARIALGAAAETGEPFPIIPVGLVFRRKDVFRSKALVLRGKPVLWDDLAGRDVSDRDTVLELTERIESAMRQLTVNLVRWEDQPIVECAEAVWTAEYGESPDPGSKLRRLEQTTAILNSVRETDDDRTGARVVREIRGFRRRLDLLGLAPAHLDETSDVPTAVRWSVGRLYLLGPPVIAVAAVGWAAFWIPYRAIVLLMRRLSLPEDQRSTYKLLCGMGLYAVWLAVLVAVATLVSGPWWGLVAAILLPVVGLVGLWVRERWTVSWRNIRRFFLVRSQRRLIARLKEERKELAAQLKVLYERWAATGPG